VQPRKKDLTFVAFARKMARATPSLSHIAFALARPRRPDRVKHHRAGWGRGVFHVKR
tara:strand:- start:358 stop:528 length:171 start_codon:yes stop_codon:yes gene_type:complete